MGAFDWILVLVLGWIYTIWLRIKPYVDIAINTAIRAASFGNTYLYRYLYNNYTKIVKHITNVFNTTNKYITNVTERITSWFADTWPSITEFTAWITAHIWGWLNSAWSSLTDFLGSVNTEINKWWDTKKAEWATWVDDTIAGFNEWKDDAGSKWDDFVADWGKKKDEADSAANAYLDKRREDTINYALREDGLIATKIFPWVFGWIEGRMEVFINDVADGINTSLDEIEIDEEKQKLQQGV